MSARDDYPDLDAFAAVRQVDERMAIIEARSALNEIDALRGDVSKLLAMLAEAGVEWPAPSATEEATP